MLHAAPEWSKEEPMAWEAVSVKDPCWYLGQGSFQETDVPGHEVASASGLFH